MSPLEQREGRNLWVMRGWVSGAVRTIVRVCRMYVCVVREGFRGVGPDERESSGWHGGRMSWVKHGNMDAELL